MLKQQLWSYLTRVKQSYNIKATSSKLFHSLCCIIIELYRSLLSCSTAELFHSQAVSQLSCLHRIKFLSPFTAPQIGDSYWCWIGNNDLWLILPFVNHILFANFYVKHFIYLMLTTNLQAGIISPVLQDAGTLNNLSTVKELVKTKATTHL